MAHVAGAVRGVGATSVVPWTWGSLVGGHPAPNPPAPHPFQGPLLTARHLRVAEGPASGTRSAGVLRSWSRRSADSDAAELVRRSNADPGPVYFVNSLLT